MAFTQRCLVNVEGRILLHLLEFSFKKLNSKNLKIYEKLTTERIADEAFTNRNNMSYYINRLKAKNYIDGTSTNVMGKKRKQMIYFLTDTGRKKAAEIKKELFNKEITILSSGQKIIGLKFPEVSEYLKKNRYCENINNFEICKLANYKGELDIDDILKVDREFIDFTEGAIKPKYFFGRVKELLRLQAWVDDPKLYRIIIIHGIAGIGKTTLASKLLEHYKNKKHLFWHNFTNWDTIRNVLSNMIDFFSQIDDDYLKMYIDFNQPLDLERILSILKEKLKGLNALFIFDDFQKANTDLRNFFASLVDIIEKTEKPKFIFISRYNIPFYDQQKLIVRNTVAELEISGLDLESSSEMLKKKRLPPEKYQEIYNITTGHPLLLEIIESDKRTRRYIFEEIFSHFAIEEHTVMEVLSTYRVPITYDAFFIDDRVSPDSINNLVQKLIIKEPSDGIYNSHEFIKDFFYKRMNPHTRRKYHKFCAEFYLNQKQPSNYLEALFHLIKSMNYQKAIELAIKKSQTIKDLGLSERFIVELEELSDDDIILPQLTEILILKAQLYFITGTWDKSLQYFYRAIETATELDKDDVKAKAFCEIGHIQEEQNSIDDALENFQRGLKIAKEINNKKIMAEAKRGMGRCHWRKSDYKTAEKYYKDSLKDLKNIDDFKLIGAINIDLGNIYYEQFKTNKAIYYYKLSLKFLKKVNDKTGFMRAYNNLGAALYYNGKWNDAIKCYKQQLELAELIGDIRSLGYGLSSAGYCYAKLNQIAEAEDYVNRAKKIFEKTNNENILFQILRTEALISQSNLNWYEAINNFNKSITLIKKLNVPFYLAETLFDFGLLYEKKDDMSKAKKCFKEAQSVFQKMGRAIPNQLKTKLLEHNRI